MKPLEHLLVAGAATVVMACGCGWYTHKLQGQNRELDARVEAAQAEVKEWAARPVIAEVEALKGKLSAAIEFVEADKALKPHRTTQSGLFALLGVYSCDRVVVLGRAHLQVYGPRAQRAAAGSRKVPGVSKVTPLPGGLQIDLQ